MQARRSGRPGRPRIIGAVRRSAALLGLIGAAAAAIALVGEPNPARGQAEGDLRISQNGAFLFIPFDDDDPNADRVKVYAARQGRSYRFQIDYAVAGPGLITTGHTFTIENAVTGERQERKTSTFDPEPAGSYNESETVPVADGWDPGVYRLEYRVFARAPGQPEAAIEGTRTFLVFG